MTRRPSAIFLRELNRVISARVRQEMIDKETLLLPDSTELETRAILPFTYFCLDLSKINKLSLLSNAGRDMVENLYISNQEVSTLLYDMSSFFWLNICDYFESFTDAKKYVAKIAYDAFLTSKNLRPSTRTALGRIFKDSEFINAEPGYMFDKVPDWDGVYTFCYLLNIYLPYSVFCDPNDEIHGLL